MKNEFEGAEFTCSDEELEQFDGVCPLTTGDEILDFFSLDIWPLYADALMVLGFIVFFHTVAFLALRWRARRKAGN